MNTNDLTACDLLASIDAALRIRDMEAAAVFILALDEIDTDAAGRIRQALSVTDARYAARRGDPLWAEHVAEQNAEWWAS